jgi:hypothetical protein
MALSKVDLANQVENQLPQNLVANNLPFRNIIINGDMSIAQRGTSSSGITSGGFYTVDRMKLNLSLGTWTQSQDSDVPTGQGFAKSFKMDCTTANASPSAALSAQIRYRMEGQMLQYLKKGTANAESLTLSFWVKSNKTGTYIAELVDNDNSRQISKSYTISSADTWEKKTLTFAGDTTGAFDNDNAASADLFFWLGGGSDYTSGTLSTSWSSITQANRAVGQVNLADSTSNYINITGVQLEAGTTASDFEFLPYDVNKRRCLRYYTQVTQDHYFAGARANGTTGLIGGRFYTSVPLRAGPTIDAGTYIYYYGDAGNGGLTGSTTAVEYQRDDTGLTFRLNSALSGVVDNQPVIVQAYSTIGFDSEL